MCAYTRAVGFWDEHYSLITDNIPKKGELSAWVSAITQKKAMKHLSAPKFEGTVSILDGF